MTHPRLTIRARLTLLSTAIFAAAGAIVIAITYTLVAQTLPVSGTVQKVTGSDEFKAACNEALKDPNADPNLKLKCQMTFQAGVKIGAQTQSDATLSHLLAYSGLTLAAVTILTALASWLVVGKVLHRIQRITTAARTASDANLSEQVALQGPRDEVYELAETFNDMLARLDASFTSQRRFIANASHELRTPLTVMRTSIDVALAKPAPTAADLSVMAHEVHGAVDHATALIEALLTLARTDRALTIREPVDLATVVEDVLDTTQVRGLDVAVSLAPARTIGDPVLLERLVANLVENAVRYNQPGGRLSIDAHASDEPSQVTVTIANTGPIVPVELIETLYEPFHRLNERTGPEGFGLGLAIAASIAAAHGGTLTAVPQPTGGLIVTLRLPQALHDPDHEAPLVDRSSG
jgi:signal transduction histidine kinase